MNWRHKQYLEKYKQKRMEKYIDKNNEPNVPQHVKDYFAEHPELLCAEGLGRHNVPPPADAARSMTNFKTAYNAENFPVDHEKSIKPSKTIPDQSMSLREVLRRYSQGLPINGIKVPLYDENPEDANLPDIEKLDMAEREELALQYAAELAELKEKYKLKNQPVKPAENAPQEQ